MWIPTDESEILFATSSGTLEETVIFDAKREIPAKGIDLAKDVSAFANTSGGSIIFGIDEDSNKRPTVPSPIALKGERERIDSIIRTSISEVPNYKITQIEASSDTSKGYLVLIIPPSERAPHMVIVKGDRRFYGRGETGNYVLSEVEVTRLYERRFTAQGNLLSSLKEKIELDNSKMPHNGFAHLHLIIQPTLKGDNLLTGANENFNSQKKVDFDVKKFLSEIVLIVLKSGHFHDAYEPNFSVPNQWTLYPDGYLGKMRYADENDKRPNSHTLNIKINFDGSGELFCGRAGETAQNRREEIGKVFISEIVAGNTVKFLALFGELYKLSSYFGTTNIGVGLTGLEGSTPYSTNWYYTHNNQTYDKSEYIKTLKLSAFTLIENPLEAASDLLSPIIEAISQGRINPLKKVD